MKYISQYYKESIKGNGYKLVSSGNSYNLVDNNGKLLFEEYYKGYKIISGSLLYFYNDYINDTPDNSLVIISQDSIEYIHVNCISNKGQVYFIEQDNKYQIMDLSGNFLMDRWYDYLFGYNEDRVIVRMDNSYNVFDIKDGFLYDVWFNHLIKICDYLIVCNNDNKYNILDKNYNLFFTEWFIDGYDIDSIFHLLIITSHNKKNILDNSMKLLLDDWVDDIEHYFDNGYALVKYNDKMNLIDTGGRFISKRWFDMCCNFFNGFAKVKDNEKYNYINLNGNLLLDEWVDYGLSFGYNKTAMVTKNGIRYLLNSQGKLTLFDKNKID